MGYSLGVDLGTTFVAAAVARDGKVEMCALGEGALVSPAVVFLAEDGGTLTGEPALRRGLTCPERMARDIRRRLGEPTPIQLGGRPHAVGELLGMLLRSVVATVTAREGTAPDQVVLARPAGWGRARQEAFAAVPQLAGLPHAALLTEPEAVAAHYAATRPLPQSGLIALYALGGGTFEVTLVQSSLEGLRFVGAPQCIERFGGLDLDEALIDFVDRAVDGAVGALDPADPGTTRALARLREECVQAKEALSGDDEAMVAVQLGAMQHDARVTRADFEGLIRPMLDSTVGAVWQALRSVQAGPPDLAGILLLGGSTRIPLVARLLEHSLARPVWTNVHAKNAVALGAAAAAAQLTSRFTSVLPRPASPLAVMPPPAPIQPPPAPKPPPAPMPPPAPIQPAPLAAVPPTPGPRAQAYPPPPYGSPYPGAPQYPYDPRQYPQPTWPDQAQAWRPRPPPHEPGRYPGHDDAAADEEWRPTPHWPRLVGGVVLLAVIIVLVLAVFAVLTRIRP